MSGSVSTPTLSVNMHLLPITSPADVSPGKYTNSSTSPSFASVVSSSAGSSSASPHLLYQHQQHGQTSPHSIKNTAPTRSPAHSSSAKYDSALASPASRTIQSSNAPDQSGSDSSEVEIYLNSLVLHDSVSRNYLVLFFLRIYSLILGLLQTPILHINRFRLSSPVALPRLGLPSLDLVSVISTIPNLLKAVPYHPFLSLCHYLLLNAMRMVNNNTPSPLLLHQFRPQSPYPKLMNANIIQMSELLTFNFNNNISPCTVRGMETSSSMAMD